MAAVAVVISVAIDPSLWRDFFSSLGAQGDYSFEGTPILHILPTPAADYLLRLAITWPSS